jgi:hypothetical protein
VGLIAAGGDSDLDFTIGDWIHFYNHERHHQALGMATPRQTYLLNTTP